LYTFWIHFHRQVYLAQTSIAWRGQLRMAHHDRARVTGNLLRQRVRLAIDRIRSGVASRVAKK